MMIGLLRVDGVLGNGGLENQVSRERRLLPMSRGFVERWWGW